MTWNPFQYQYTATYLKDEGDEAVLELRKGSTSQVLHFPKNLLPTDLETGASFTLKVEDIETAKNSESEALKELLSNLIQ